VRADRRAVVNEHQNAIDVEGFVEYLHGGAFGGVRLCREKGGSMWG
jgi:hypothetical protein